VLTRAPATGISRHGDLLKSRRQSTGR